MVDSGYNQNLPNRSLNRRLAFVTLTNSAIFMLDGITVTKGTVFRQKSPTKKEPEFQTLLKIRLFLNRLFNISALITAIKIYLQ